MLNDHLIRRTPFEGCISSYEEARIVLFGAGYDGTSSYRPGSRFAPMAIRAETLYSQEDYSPYFDRDLKDLAIHDAGDLELPFGSKEVVLELIETLSLQLISDGKRPVMIGGEHLVTFPALKAIITRFPDLHILQLDAHLDLADSLFGSRLSHGTVMRRSGELLPSWQHLWQVGIRSGAKAEFDFARNHTRLFPFDTLEFQKVVTSLNDKPVYLTLDLDVFDPSLIPGTGTPEAGGIFFQEYIQFLRCIEHLNIVGADIVELAPQLDSSGSSTAVSSKILREMLMVL